MCHRRRHQRHQRLSRTGAAGRRTCCSSRRATIAPAPAPRCRAWCMAACAIWKTASSSWCRNRCVERDRLLAQCAALRRAAADDGAGLRHLLRSRQRRRPLPRPHPPAEPPRRSRHQGRADASMISSRASAPADAAAPVPRARARRCRHGRRSIPATKSSATYYDAWVSQPERLGIEMLQDGLAASAAARALNYARDAARRGRRLVAAMTVSAGRSCRHRARPRHQRHRRLDRHHQ